ncbi:MAG: phenylalanine--tRNA ligase subunit beta [Gemmatimonadota bacterium]
MNISRRWLEAFLDRPLDPQDLAARLAMLGAPADAVMDLAGELSALVVGRVDGTHPHPNAERLTVCAVNDGSGTLHQVICGAPNVTVGKSYPFARIGVTLPGGLTLEKRKIRGETSHGMLCSARELGLGEEHDGILELDGEPPPGSSFVDHLGLGDHRLVLDITPNRPDLLGHKGVARELAASLGVPMRLPQLPGEGPELPPITRVASGEATTAGLTVRIDDVIGCGRFLGAVIHGVTIGRSPDWLRRRLEAAGVRSINNVVDATNYVLLELGQPLHAYDLARLRGNLIAARSAQAGERLTTLDGVTRTLAPGMLVIGDGERVVGVAGVMGGEDTEVRTDSTDLFLECAWFSPGRVRATRTALGITSEASYRFERGVDRWNGPEALRRALEIILRTAGGTVAAAPVDIWPDQAHPPRIFLRRARVTQVLGIALPLKEIEKALVAVGATVVAKPDDDRIAVEVPGWRPDLVEEIDLVEEVARHYGYDNIPSELRPFRVGSYLDSPIEDAADRVRRGMVAEGLLEVVTLPLGPADPEGAVALQNPLSADHGFLRRRLLPGLIREVERNWSAHQRDIRLFEVGTSFLPSGGAGAPHEELHLAAVLTGGRAPAHWTASGKIPDVDLWDLKALFEEAVLLAQPGTVVQVEGRGWVARRADGTKVGEASRLDADRPNWAGPVFGFEVVVDPAVEGALGFTAFPTTPSVERDLALVVPDGVTAASVQEATRAAAGGLLESVAVVDEYRGKGLPPGTRSLAIRLVFRAADRTLRDPEVDAAVGRVCSALEKRHHVVLRTA